MYARSVAALLGAVFAAASGCAGPAVHPTPENDAAIATGIGEPIQFEVERGALDAEGDSQGTLSLSNAVRLALKNSPAVQAALGRVRVAEAEAKQARLLPNPVVSVALRYPEGGGKPVIEAGLTEDLISILRRPGLTAAADNRLRIAASEAVKVVLDVVSETEERYAAAQSLDAQLEVIKERQAIVDRLASLAKARLEGGEATGLDVLSIDAQRVELRTELAEKELERREERLALTRLIGQPSGTAEWGIERFNLLTGSVASERAWVEKALQRRPEVQAQRFELLALGGELSASALAPFSDSQVGVDSERDGSWTWGPAASFSVPLFDVGQAQRERARAAIIEARHNLTRIEREVVEETRKAYATLLASQENLTRVRNELIPVQERRLAQAEAQFRGGETDVTALLFAEQELIASRVKFIEIEQRAATARIRLERAVGGHGVAATLIPSTNPSTTQPANEN